MFDTPAKHQYVNGKELFEEMLVYKESCNVAKALGLPRPPITDKIASSIIRISNKLSNSYNFIGYSYKDEMIADGIIKCVEKIHLFNPEKSENVFAYATQIIFNSFINRIKLEQKQASIRARLINDKITSEFVEQSLENDVDATNAFVGFLKDNNIFVDYYEERKENEHTGTLHPSLKHRNLTPYVKKNKEISIKPSAETNLYDLTS